MVKLFDLHSDGLLQWGFPDAGGLVLILYHFKKMF